MKDLTKEEVQLLSRLLIIERFKIQHTREMQHKSEIPVDERVLIIDDLYKKINNEE